MKVSKLKTDIEKLRPSTEVEGMWEDINDEESEYILISDITNKVLHLNKEVKLLEGMK